jgi:hypothetical protein
MQAKNEQVGMIKLKEATELYYVIGCKATFTVPAGTEVQCRRTQINPTTVRYRIALIRNGSVAGEAVRDVVKA